MRLMLRLEAAELEKVRPMMPPPPPPRGPTSISQLFPSESLTFYLVPDL